MQTLTTEKLLIANRGEIACRIMRTCRLLGLPTVAIYSEADRDSLHVEMADETVEVGPAQVRQSYANPEAILSAARQTGATAVHPGYGFLSESSEFAQTVLNADLRWVGPTPQSIAEMGDKERARIIASGSGVPTLPGSTRFVEGDLSGLRQAAAAVGYPLLVKASAGGGGIGMQRVDEEEQLESLVASTQSMVGKAFGDSSVYLERYVASARHIEVQVFGYGDGSGVHLYDRDCSIQRRFQKIVEEAPAPNVPDSVREAMRDAAMALVRRQHYRGAGTVEFIYDNHRAEAYFLEMNTRIQVEHPVTEMVTGVDLVAWQLLLTFDLLAPVSQSTIKLRGHAVEGRLYAERPDKNFMPAPGVISHLRWPIESCAMRIDTGVRAGDRVTPYYDPLIAKMIAYGVDRDTAIARLAKGLSELDIGGISTNASFLGRAVTDPAFATGSISTGFVNDLVSRRGVS